MKLELGERIKSVRGDLGREAFAQIVGSNRNSIARYEKGEGSPSMDLAKAICDNFDININWLFTGEGPEHKGQEPDQSPVTAESSPQYSGQLPDDDIGLGESVELLAKIYNSGNQVLVRAIAANLHAFSEAVDNKALAMQTIGMMDEINKRMLAQENELATMKEKLARMESEGDGRATATA